MLLLTAFEGPLETKLTTVLGRLDQKMKQPHHQIYGRKMDPD